MKTITISYSRRKHHTDEYEENIISAFQALGFEYDGSDITMDINMTRGLFFIVPDNKQDIEIEVNTFEDDEDEE
jgi:hypothetical protein